MASNRFMRVLSAGLFASLLAVGGNSMARAQGTTTLRAEIDAIKAELANLQAVAAAAPTMAQAVQELSSKVVVIEQELAQNGSLRESIPGAVVKIDEIESELVALRTDLEYLRTSIANIEQPAASGGGGGIDRSPAGWSWAAADGRYKLALTGYFQARYETQLPSNLDTQDTSTFRARRARVGLQGALGEKLSYALSFELTTPSVPLRDFYMDMKYSDAFNVRIGQAKLPFMRSFLASSRDRDFLELSELQERVRYDRDLGVWAMGQVLGGKLRYAGGVSNGSGGNSLNDNVDMLLTARVEGVAMGDYIRAGFGDHAGTQTPSLTLGLAGAHDLARPGQTVSGIELGNRDVDGDGVLDNVRVMSAVVDAQFRYRGFEAFVEGHYRHERWGTILDHEDNSDLADLIKPSDAGRRNYLGFSAQASYFILANTLEAGSRVSHGRLPLLGVGGQDFSAPPKAQRLLQTDVFVQMWREGYRRVGMTYSLINYNEIDAPDPADDMKHQIIVEAQLVL